MHGSAGWNTNRVGRGWRLGLLAAGATIACVATMAYASTANAARVYITLGFDDGLISQFNNRDVLQKYGVEATYFINSGNVGLPGAMTWDNLRTLQAEGNEIGGHTKTHKNLRTDLSPAQLQDPNGELCGDRATLISHGFPTLNFAYPYGEDGIGDPNTSTRAATQQAIHQAVQNCGYKSARTTRGIDVPGECSELGPPLPDCVWAETLPPIGAGGSVFALRAGESHLGMISGTAPDKWRWADSGPTGGIRGAITRARNYKGGWFNIVLHDICVGQGDDNCPSPPNDYAIPRDRLDHLLAWIQADPQLQVVTTAQALGQVPIPPKFPIDPRSNPGVVVSINPLASIASLKKGTKKRWKLTVKIKHPTKATKLQVILDGRVIRTITKLKSTNVFTIKPGAGKHTIKVRATGTDGKRYTSATRTFHVKKATKKKKKKS